MLAELPPHQLPLRGVVYSVGCLVVAYRQLRAVVGIADFVGIHSEAPLLVPNSRIDENKQQIGDQGTNNCQAGE